MLGEIKINVYRAVEQSLNFPQKAKSCRYIASGIVSVHERINFNGLPGVWLGSDGSQWFLFRVTVINTAGVFENILMFYSTFTPKGKLV